MCTCPKLWKAEQIESVTDVFSSRLTSVVGDSLWNSAYQLAQLDVARAAHEP